jgi:23S rRNA pseudouridine2605 synthase
MVRINKFLALCELGSRRKVEELITSGKVCVNGIVCMDLSKQVDPDKDIVKLNRKVISPETKKYFIILNKPKGYVVTKRDEFNRKTIFDLLPDFAAKLHPIGRLDRDSEGLILLTNDGDITNKLIHPKSKIEKTYKVSVKGKVDMQRVSKLRIGVDIKTSEDSSYTTQSAKVFLKHATDEKSELKITITEGKNRQIRKMVESIGHEVISLKRVQFAHLKLDKIPTGSWRFLSDIELLTLLKKVS